MSPPSSPASVFQSPAQSPHNPKAAEAVPGLPAPPAVKAASAILVDAVTGQVIFAKNEHTRRPNASTTKVMTVLLALEHGKLDDQVAAPGVVKDIPESSFHLLPGEKLSLLDLLYAACVRSANDAAWAIAEHVGGTVPKFVEMMNARAREIGMKDTQFKNPNGLNAPGHYSSAYDLALLTREAIKTPLFNELVNTRSITIDRSSSQDKLLRARSKFLLHYPGADGIKSGYTRQAGHCYIGAATENGWRLISVVLKSSSAGEDTKALMSYGFKHFERLQLAKAGARYTEVEVPNAHPEKLPLILQDDLSVVAPKGRSKSVKTRLDIAYVRPPINKGDVVGYAVASGGSSEVRVPLLAAEDAREARNNLLGFLAVGACLPLGYAGIRRAASDRRARGGRRASELDLNTLLKNDRA
ncbi:MAG: D-alanyl-D-alanine carboxypeptidase [Armatimonadetes bacterium]|nr:D-alanyl-D-alanine carboxypeptidase [Armatimonadota bacterium]